MDLNDLGLAVGVSEGVKNFADAYRDAQDRSMKRRMMQVQMLNQGYQTDDSGNVVPTAARQQQMDFQTQSMDANSDVSKRARTSARGLLEQVKPGLGAAINDNMSKAELDSMVKEGLLGDAVKGIYNAQGMAAKNATFADRNSGNASKDYETRMQPYRGTNEDIARVESALQTKDKNGNPLITKQQLGDANAAIARIFSPGHMSDATVSRTEYESVPAMFSGALQKLSTNPQDIGSRDLVNHIIDQAHHIGNVTNQNALRELDSLDSGYSQFQEPAVRAVANSKSQDFRKRFSKRYSTVGETQGLLNKGESDQDQSQGPHGATVYQNGYMYTWNPQTKGYE